MNTIVPDYNELVEMAKNDPERLEKMRQQWIEELINSAPKHYQRRLRGLQFKIDMERRRSKSDLVACIRLSSMLHESFTELCHEIDGLYDDELYDVVPQEAELIPFKKKKETLP